MTSPRIQILYFRGCPHHRPTVEMTEAVLRELGVPAEIEEIEVRDEADAARLRFLGSPSVRVDGADIEPGAESRDTYGLACRLYGTSGLPPREMLRSSLTAGSDAGK